MANEDDQQAFPNLQGAEFMILTTYKRDTTPVPTTVWFAQAGDKLYVTTTETTGKAKRIKATPQVTVEPSTRVGESLGPALPAQAHILAGDEANTAEAALLAKYPEAARVFHQMASDSAAATNKRIFMVVTAADK